MKNEIQQLIASLNDLQYTDDDHTPHFLRYLRHENPGVRDAAIQGLRASNPEDTADALIEVAGNDPEGEVRNRALSIMGYHLRRGGAENADAVDRFRKYLAGILNDATLPLADRRRALDALAMGTGPEEASLLLSWANDPDPEMRRHAISCMGKTGTDRWVTPLLAALDDPDRDVRREAILACGRLALPGAVPRLVRFLRDNDRQLVFDVIEALGSIGGGAAELLLRAMAKHTADREALAAIEAARDRIGDLDADELLIARNYNPGPPGSGIPGDEASRIFDDDFDEQYDDYDEDRGGSYDSLS